MPVELTWLVQTELLEGFVNRDAVEMVSGSATCGERVGMDGHSAAQIETDCARASFSR